jgi:hypothetical protein
MDRAIVLTVMLVAIEEAFLFRLRYISNQPCTHIQTQLFQFCIQVGSHINYSSLQFVFLRVIPKPTYQGERSSFHC